jgi:hypothetical protein
MVEKEILSVADLRCGHSLECVAFKTSLPLCFDEMSQWWAIVLLSGKGIAGNDAMTVPDYLAIGFLLVVMPLIAARWFAQRKFELFSHRV